MIFDPTLNFRAKLEEAFKQARQQNKNVLVEFGGDWCIWSLRMAKLLNKPKIKSIIEQHFVFIRCPVSNDEPCPYPEELELPEINSVPFFMLVSPDGELLNYQETDCFEILWFYRAKWFERFLHS